MRHILYKYLTGASMIALTFSLNTSTANATCSAMPTCSELGYTETSCSRESLKCPFDTTKMKCIKDKCWNYPLMGTPPSSPSKGQVEYCPEDNNRYKYISCVHNDYQGGGGYLDYQLIDGDCVQRTSCYQLGYWSESCGSHQRYIVCPYDDNLKYCLNECDSSYVYNSKTSQCEPSIDCNVIGYTETGCENHVALRCPYDINKLLCLSDCVAGTTYNQGTGQCETDYHACTSASVGEFYYSDNTCSANYDTGKTAIGIVYDTTNKWVLSLDQGTGSWGPSGSVSGLSSYNNLDTAVANVSGLENTNKIVSYAATSGKTYYAAQYCHDMTTGGKTWYLPAIGQMRSWITSQNAGVLDVAFGKAGVAVPSGNYWSSTQGDIFNAWYQSKDDNDHPYMTSKTATYPHVRCVFSY